MEKYRIELFGSDECAFGKTVYLTEAQANTVRALLGGDCFRGDYNAVRLVNVSKQEERQRVLREEEAAEARAAAEEERKTREKFCVKSSYGSYSVANKFHA